MLKVLLAILVCLLEFRGGCGKTNFHLSSFLSNQLNSSQRVVGGADVPQGQYVPYQVSLQYHTRTGEYKHFCGGSILAPDRILTAAHCCNGLNPVRMSIVAGIRNLDDKTGQRSQVLGYDINENYQELITSDIAILRIEPPLELDGVRMAAIDVSGAEEVDGGQIVTLTGWGLRLPVAFPLLPPEWETINYPNTLQSVNYTTLTNQQCRNTGIVEPTDTEICAKGHFLKGACSGDSGGPLVMRSNEQLRQVGVVSYGLVVCGVGFLDVPDVYTRVSKFDVWIQQHMK